MIRDYINRTGEARENKIRGPWVKAGQVLHAWKLRSKIEGERLLILNQIWEREMGAFVQQWTLKGVRGGILYVHPRSSVAAHELMMRSGQIVRGLNKYFKRSWIKGIKTTLQ